ncbi:hypoxanthine phosphoribosyltransferase [Brevundimonas nasdae]|jgi:hypoxanthine phosphoribosyltransferase|uniref:phosphoribosyltransferase n=1 Tax=Brevundimonas nasdae TaxID=172043 RepID=UPI0019131302|nr:phosphoribosyltransferase family protein [Brevundimonas nasdae]MBK6025200.1 phosphoribosyltransferase [Brevundimonas nasdae]MDQ0452018.1 hypoxanthine phosphoribosyltransferase [Brevundimonas nasdae]
MADTSPTPTVLLPEADIARIVAELADRIAPVIDDDTVATVLLTGGLWFAADLTRALSRAGRNVRFDALWLSSYGDDKTSRGQINVYAPFQRPIAGRRVLILDDVFDTGLSLAEAVRIAKEGGASEVLTCVFARKPWPKPRAPEPDFVGWEAPNRFLVGYGLDHAGSLRGLPDICAMD